MGTYTSFWRNTTGGMLTQISVTPYGWDDKAYFVQQAGKANAKEFKTVKEEAISGDAGPAQAVALFLNARQQLSTQATELFVAQSLVLYPKDVPLARPKTADECRLDEAMLYVEIEQFDRAEELLKQIDTTPNTLFANTVARRLYANKVLCAELRSDAEKKAWQQLAVQHAQRVLNESVGLDLDTFECYGFGDDYKSAKFMVAAAAETLGRYFLEDMNDAKQALAALEIGESTYYSGTEAWDLKVRALMQLGLVDEAFVFHKDRHLTCDVVLKHPGYQKFLENVELQKLAQIQPTYHLRFPNAYGFAKPFSAAVAELQEKYQFSDDYAEFLRAQNGIDYTLLPDNMAQSPHVQSVDVNEEGCSDLRVLYGLNNDSSYYELSANVAGFDMLLPYFFPIGSSAGGNQYVEVLAGKYKGYIGSLDHELYLGCKNLKAFVKEMDLNNFFKLSLVEQTDVLADEELGLLWIHATSFTQFVDKCVHFTAKGWGFVKDAVPATT